MNREKNKRSDANPEHNVPVARRRFYIPHKRNEEMMEFRSPSLSAEDICRLADQILEPETK